MNNRNEDEITSITPRFGLLDDAWWSQETPQSVLQHDQIAQFALPDHQHLPSSVNERRLVSLISDFIAIELVTPKVHTRLWYS